MSDAAAPETRPPPDSTLNSAGKLHVVDLTQLKSRLGSKWTRLQGHVEQFFVTAIQRSLGPGDTFSRIDELSYVVLFRGLNESEAQLKCQTISQDVCQRLFGEQATQVKMRNLVLAVTAAEAPDGPEGALALNALLEATGKETIVSVGPKEEKDEHTLRLGSASQPFVTIPRGSIEFVYRPIWDTFKQIVVTYLCQPLLPTHGKAAPPSAICMAENDDDQAELDLLVLREAAGRVRRLRMDGLRVLAAAPVSFVTLTRSRYWSNYARAYRLIPAEVVRDMGSLVFDIDPGVPGIRLVQELPKLAGITRNLFCTVNDADGTSAAHFAGTGTSALGKIISPLEAEPNTIEYVRRFAQHSRDAGLEAFVLGVRSTSVALNALNTGVRYLEGPAVRAACADPRHGYSQSLDYLYAGKIARKATVNPN